MTKLLCACGCGQEIIATPHHKYRPTRFIPGHNYPSRNIEVRRLLSKIQTERPIRYWLGKKRPDVSGNSHFNWNGGVKVRRFGYVSILKRNHPYADSTGYVLAHRLVMEKSLGRYLEPLEVVHHIDGNVKNNNINNLVLYSSHSEHMRVEHRDSRRKGSTKCKSRL